MANGRKYYVRLPIPGRRGDECDFVLVDQTRLRLNVLTEIWEKDAGDLMSGGPRYMPAQGAGLAIDEEVDISDVLQTMAELKEECCASLSLLGEPGATVRKQIIDSLNLEEVFINLARGQTQQATWALRTVLYGIMGGCASIASTLKEKEVEATGLQVAVTHLVSAVDAKGEITEKLYFNWAEAADTVNLAVSRLSRLEETVRDNLGHIEEIRARWQEGLNERNPVIQAALNFLDRSECSFIIQAFGWRKNPIPRPLAEQLIQQAKSHIFACRSQEKVARLEWETHRKRMEQEILPQRAEIQRRCDELECYSRRLREFCQKVTAETPRPFQYDPMLISQEQYELAEATLRDSRWAPRTALQRLQGLLNSSVGWMELKPSLPEAVALVLENAEAYISDIEQDWVEEGAQTLNEEAVSEEEEAEAPVSAEPADTDEQRAQDLYNLVLCVGSELTCSPRFKASSNIRAMLDVVRYLGRCTEAETVTYRDAVFNLSKREGEREVVSEGKMVIPRWKASPVTWIQYNAGGSQIAALKLTEKARERVDQLMVQYGLTREVIRSAHVQKRNEQRLAWEAKRKEKQ